MITPGDRETGIPASIVVEGPETPLTPSSPSSSPSHIAGLRENRVVRRSLVHEPSGIHVEHEVSASRCAHARTARTAASHSASVRGHRHRRDRGSSWRKRAAAPDSRARTGWCSMGTPSGCHALMSVLDDENRVPVPRASADHDAIVLLTIRHGTGCPDGRRCLRHLGRHLSDLVSAASRRTPSPAR